MLLLTPHTNRKPRSSRPRLNPDNLWAQRAFHLSAYTLYGSGRVWDAAARIEGVWRNRSGVEGVGWVPAPTRHEQGAGFATFDSTAARNSEFLFPSAYNLGTNEIYTTLLRGRFVGRNDAGVAGFRFYAGLFAPPASAVADAIGLLGCNQPTPNLRLIRAQGGTQVWLHSHVMATRRWYSMLVTWLPGSGGWVSIYDLESNQLVADSLAANAALSYVGGTGCSLGTAGMLLGATNSGLQVSASALLRGDIPSLDDRMSLHLNPWQMFEPERRLVYSRFVETGPVITPRTQFNYTTIKTEWRKRCRARTTWRIESAGSWSKFARIQRRGKYNMAVERTITDRVVGDDLIFDCEYTDLPVDVEIEEARLTIRTSPGAAEAVGEATVTTTLTGQGQITLAGGEDGIARLWLKIPYSVTKLFRAGRAYSYDIQLISSLPEIHTPEHGTIVFKPQVTMAEPV